MQFDFSFLDAAGITQREMAEVIGVSRPTANLWINGHKIPGSRRVPRLRRFADLVGAAVSAGKLPALPETRAPLLKEMVKALDTPAA